jgi:hypothetical protein
MSGKRDSEPSPESVARANRRRLASEEGVRAMADIAQGAANVRKNMERLRSLREARDALEPAAASETVKKPARKLARVRPA